MPSEGIESSVVLTARLSRLLVCHGCNAEDTEQVNRQPLVQCLAQAQHSMLQVVNAESSSGARSPVVHPRFEYQQQYRLVLRLEGALVYIVASAARHRQDLLLGSLVYKPFCSLISTARPGPDQRPSTWVATAADQVRAFSARRRPAFFCNAKTSLHILQLQNLRVK